jgi:hypothetical protein
MNAPYKQLEIRRLLNNSKFSFISILENKLTLNSIDSFMNKIQNKWKFSHNIVDGQKCRILIIWDSTQWSNIILHTNEQYITAILHNSSGLSVICTSVYGHNDEIRRNDLWKYLIDQSLNINLPWLVAGDFNSILSHNERLNNGVCSDMGDQVFIDCINKSKLIEPIFSGNFYTWRGGLHFSIHSKIDRVFVNDLWSEKFKQYGINFGNHSISDHTPITIKLSNQNMKRRSIPFKYNNSWHRQRGYQNIIQPVLEQKFPGNALYNLLCKLKIVKSELKIWMSSNSNIYSVLDKLKEETNEIYKQLVQEPLNSNLVEEYCTKNEQIHEIMRNIAIDNEQRMKINWLTKGDKPTEFFFSKINNIKPARGNNLILQDNGSWFSASEKIGSEAITYFSNLFSSPIDKLQFPDIICKRILSQNAKENLCKPFLLEEVKNAVFQINDNSSPGPDGINSKFYKIHWEQIKNDIWDAMNSILQSGKIIKEINHTFICLIPKKPNAVDMIDFRPISLCNVSYKILANLLCNRMKSLMNELISYNQNAFIPGRVITDNSLLAFEMIRGFNRKKSNNLCLKIDLHKAYDKINRDFIHHMLISMNFPLIFADLIYECITTPTFSVLVEGSPYGFINSSRGIRQGDPLSPYLFAIAMEYLTINLEMEFLKGNLSPIYQIEPVVTHLIYADDILILTKATVQNATCIKHVFQNLNNITGLELNPKKTTLFLSKGAINKNQIANTLNVSIGNLPIIYLGIPLSNNKLRARDFGELIDQINKKFNHWHSKMLNISGRTELIKTVIHPILQFWLQFTQFPVAIIQRINTLCANFLWKSKAHQMKWEEVCRTKSEGGFGIRKIEDISKAVATNLLWKFINCDSLWAKWTHNKYCKNENFWNASIDHNASYTWKTLLRARQWCKGLITKNIVNGDTTSLWFDPWINGTSLIDNVGWNAMTVLRGSDKKVSDLISNNKWKQNINFVPTQYHQTIHNINIQPQMEKDHWKWIPSNNGQYTLKSAWNQLRNKQSELFWTKIIWGKGCAPKMSTCALLAIQNKLKTKVRISRWNTNIDQQCNLCTNHLEDRDHLFFNCPYSSKLLENVMQKLNLDFKLNFNINHILECISKRNKNQTLISQITNVAFTSLIWNIWCERNNRIFRNIEMQTSIRSTLINQDVKSLMQYVIKDREVSRDTSLIFDNWNIANKPMEPQQPP